APGTPLVVPDLQRQIYERKQLQESPYSLDLPRRQVVLRAVCEMATRKKWTLHAVHVRTNHIHIIVTANGPPERAMNDFKTAASRRLNKAFPAERARPR